MSIDRIKSGLQPDRETGDQSKDQEEPRIWNEVFVLDDLLTKWERDYFKLKLVKDVVKVTCLIDLEIGEYNQVVENIARECESRIKNKAKETGQPAPIGKELQDMVDKMQRVGRRLQRGTPTHSWAGSPAKPAGRPPEPASRRKVQQRC